MDIGTALKKIRTNLNLNLEEMSAGVITASHYSNISRRFVTNFKYSLDRRSNFFKKSNQRRS